MVTRILCITLAASLVRVATAIAEPSTWVEGDWIGGFEGRSGTVFMSAHFEASSGQLTGRLDLPTRGDRHVPLERIDVNDGRMSFELPGASGNLLFQGSRKKDGRVIGSVRQAEASIDFELIKLAALAPEALERLAGTYEVEPGRVILIARGPGGLLYSDERDRRFGTLYPTAPGTLVAGPSVAAGYPVELTVTYAPGESAVERIEWRRKGEPARIAVRRTYYRTEQVGYYSGDVRLSATLVLPNGPGPHPAVVMIHGSGPVTRDALRPWADMYARRGVAVLIADKRGAGASTGNWARASFQDLAADALAGLEFLRARPEVNGRQIGLHGMSLGGWVAPLAAAQSDRVAFVIVESAPVLTPIAHERLRVEQQMRADGYLPDAVARASAFMDQKFEVARTGEGWEKLGAASQRAAREGWASYVNPPSSLESLRWHWDHVLSYDPMPALERMRCPVLVLYGGLDTIVPVTHSRAKMQEVLRKAGNRDSTVLVFERANHAFLEAASGGKREALALRGFVSGYFDTHVDWLRSRVTIAPVDAPGPALTETAIAPAFEAPQPRSDQSAAWLTARPAGRSRATR